MTEPNDFPQVPAEAAEAVVRPPTAAEASAASPPTAGEVAPAAVDDSAASPGVSSVDAKVPTPAAAPRPFWQAFGHALVHLLAMGSILFVLVGIAPRVERICEQMQYDDRSALTTFVFDAGYFVRKSWFLVPLLLLFDLGVLLILRRALNPALARNYTTIVVGVALLLTILLGFGLLDPLTVLYKRHF